MKVFLVFLTTTIVIGCSSSAQKPNTVRSNATQPAAGAQANGADPGNPAAPLSPVENQPGVAANSLKPNVKPLVDSAGTPVPPTRIPAPENSEVATTMDASGNFVENRWFKNHPQLSRIERTWLDAEKSTLKIYLRDGRVVTAPGDSVKTLPSHPSSSFLELAGLRAPAKVDPATGAKSN